MNASIAPEIHLITGCTSRKTVPQEKRVKARELTPGPITEVVSEWGKFLCQAERKVKVRDFYAGRGFLEAKKTVGNNGQRLWVVSAGLGIVNGDWEVPAYDLTISNNSADSITRKINLNKGWEKNWWSAVESGLEWSKNISSLIKENPYSIFVISLPDFYFSMINEKLKNLSKKDMSRVRIISTPNIRFDAISVAEQIVPYGSGLDGPDSNLKGTKADFYQRAARHFVENVLIKDPMAPAQTHRRLVKGELERMRLPDNPKRQKMSDTEIINLIDQNWENMGGKAEKLLRWLRDEKQVACEQGRFSRMFNKVKEDKRAK